MAPSRHAVQWRPPHLARLSELAMPGAPVGESLMHFSVMSSRGQQQAVVTSAGADGANQQQCRVGLSACLQCSRYLPLFRLWM